MPLFLSVGAVSVLVPGEGQGESGGQSGGGGSEEGGSADDCVGAETGVLITGGKFYGLSLNNDVFDVNAGDITIAGGLVLAYTTAQEPTDDPSRTVGSFGFDP